jgi:hypothetical protein
MTLLVSESRLNEVLDHKELDHNKGKFLMITKNRTYVAVDNTTSEAHIESFDCLIKAADWLNRKLEVES